MEKIIMQLAEMLASAEQARDNAQYSYLEARDGGEPANLENDLSEYACGYADAMRYALQAVKDYHQQQYIREARKSAGWRELYAIEHGRPQRNGNIIRWTYSEAEEYQDGNGATYDIERRQWVG